MRLEKLKLSFSAPASPARVVQLASQIEQLVVAAGLDPNSDDVTIIIENYRLRSVATARNERGQLALQLVADVVSDPGLKRVAVTAAHRAVAGVVVGLISKFDDAEPRITLPGRMRARAIGRSDLKRMEAAVRDPAAQPKTRYTTATLITPVLRCGSTEEGGAEAARLLVDGRAYEIAIDDPQAVPAFHDAAKSKGPYRVQVELAFRDGEGGRMFAAQQSRAIRVVQKMATGGGARFLRESKALKLHADEDAT